MKRNIIDQEKGEGLRGGQDAWEQLDMYAIFRVYISYIISKPVQLFQHYATPDRPQAIVDNQILPP